MAVGIGAPLATTLAAELSAAGNIQGRVVNAASGNFLNNVRVVVRGTTIETTTNDLGEFLLPDVPVGDAQVTVTFAGMEPQVATIPVVAGQTKRRDFSLTLAGQQAGPDKIVQLEAYSVVEREMSGQAIALQERRGAPNIKTVISLDEFGDMGEGNIGEYLKFVPGISLSYNPQTPAGASIRGMPSGTIVMANGAEMGSPSDGTRGFDLGVSASGNVDRVEVSKVPTPEMPANAIGGTINIVTKSGFSRSKPLLSYNVFLTNNALNGISDVNPSLHKQAGPDPKTSVPYSQPAFNLSYILPLNKRLAFTFALSRAPRYSDCLYLRSIWDYVQGLQTVHRPNRVILTEERAQAAMSVDWKPVDRHLVQVSFQGSNQTIFTRQLALFATAGANATGGPTFTQGAPTAVGNMQQNFSTWTSQYKTLRHSTLSYRYDGLRWKFDANAAYSLGALRRKDTEDGFFSNITARITGLVVRYEGLDRMGEQRIAVISAANSAGRPVDVLDGNNYSITAVSANPVRVDDEVKLAGFNVRRDLSFPVPVSVKVGAAVNQRTKDTKGGSLGWTFSPPGGAAAQVARNYDLLADGYSARTNFTDATGNAINVKWLSPYKMHSLYLTHPEYFVKSAAVQASEYTSGVNLSKRLQETIPAAYVRGDVRFFNNRLWLVGGVRFEQTRDEGLGPLNDIGATYQRDATGAFRRDAAGRLVAITTDVVARSRLQYTERGARSQRVYEGYFPSFNSSFEITPSLLVRAAYAKTISRPDLPDIIPGVTVADPDSSGDARTITVINSGLRPWTANNYDLTLELYEVKGATASVSLFRKEISNFFGTVRTPATPALLEEFGLTENYLAYDILTKRNFGEASLDGVEVGYRQSLAAFLPGWSNGWHVYGNVTSLALGGANANDFSWFSPRNISWGVSYARPKLIGKINVAQSKYVRKGPVAVSATVPVGTYAFNAPQTRIDLSGEYRFTKRLSVYGSIRNLTHSVERRGTRGPGIPEYAQFDFLIHTGSLFTLGLKGDF